MAVDRVGMKSRSPFLVAALMLLGACATPGMSAPLTPNPVLLGPIDRIGGAVVPKDEKTIGPVTSVTSDGVAGTFSATLAASVQNQTQGQEDRSARIHKLVAASAFWLYFVGPVVFVGRREAVMVSGDATEVSHVAR
jgi:hypothetical protein